ncbi:putative ubiquitin c-terminal hydrolase [Diplodia seriata]|uniref:ubiquitinyl hydrolase 1 n=1 Tax=Diplodia seriata TaxID=420778 RepID=A0A0G2HBT1_9PEZI|nr:putative ubiquitin c-terminal hydrolase [Diplodia seriata]
MSSFFGRLRSNAPPASPSTAVAPAKKDPNAPQPTPLEKLLATDTSPIRANGSDKFFGFENFGSTWKSGAGPGVPASPSITKPEENKDSPEYKKKQAMAAGPVLNMDYENSKAYGMPESLFTSLKDIFEAIIAHRSRRDEAFLDLSVDLEQNSSVTSCLKRFSEEEMLCERNKFHCDNCGGLQEAEKQDMQRLQKLFHRVVYPYYLRLFNTTDDAEDPDRLYELYAVVVHIGGGAYHGHYVSIIKTEDRGWLLFDDEMVEPVDKSYVRNFFGGENVLACAYVLFYQETTEEAMKKEQESEVISPDFFSRPA